jgi:hypothetical protein
MSIELDFFLILFLKKDLKTTSPVSKQHFLKILFFIIHFTLQSFKVIKGRFLFIQEALAIRGFVIRGFDDP